MMKKLLLLPLILCLVGFSFAASVKKSYITGPKGGCYYINSNKNKTYVDRSLCSKPVVKPLVTPKVTTSGKTCYTGPRGGRYYINSKGNKVYGC